jgi:hypothetical protein
MIFGEKNALFSTRRPVNALSGLSSGLKSITKGIVAGTATIVAAPIVGAKTDGVKGFFGGLIGGVIGGTALITSGVGVGILFLFLTSKVVIKQQGEFITLQNIINKEMIINIGMKINKNGTNII